MHLPSSWSVQRAQEGCDGLRAENPEAHPNAMDLYSGAILFLESVQTLASISRSQKIHEISRVIKSFPESVSCEESRTVAAFKVLSEVRKHSGWHKGNLRHHSHNTPYSTVPSDMQTCCNNPPHEDQQAPESGAMAHFLGIRACWVRERRNGKTIRS